MAEARRKKRSSPDKADVKLYERLARLLSHIKDLWNGHQSLLRVNTNSFIVRGALLRDIHHTHNLFAFSVDLLLVVAEQAGERIPSRGGYWQCFRECKRLNAIAFSTASYRVSQQYTNEHLVPFAYRSIVLVLHVYDLRLVLCSVHHLVARLSTHLYRKL